MSGKHEPWTARGRLVGGLSDAGDAGGVLVDCFGGYTDIGFRGHSMKGHPWVGSGWSWQFDRFADL